MIPISVIVLVYKTELYIEQCAVSLFEQTFGDIEYIFVNDCTPDRSMEILSTVLDRYPDRKSQVKIVEHKTNRGSAAARNTGLNAVRGEYVIYVDSDDWIESDMLEKLYKKACETDSDIVICDFYAMFSHHEKHIRQQPRSLAPHDITRQLLHKELLPALWNKLVRRQLYTVNNIRMEDNVNMGEDMSMIPRLTYYAHRIEYINSPFYHYRILNPLSYTNNISVKTLQDIQRVVEILASFFNAHAEFIRDIFIFKVLTKNHLFVCCKTLQDYQTINALYPELAHYPELDEKIAWYYRDAYRLATQYKCFIGYRFAKIVKKVLEVLKK